MSKSNPSEVKLAVPTSGGFSGLKSLNLQVFVMIAAIIAIMLFFPGPPMVPLKRP